MYKPDLEIPLARDRSWKYRLAEIFPGALSWFILALPLILAIISPVVSSFFVILYMVGWLIKAVVMIFRVLQGYKRMEQYSSMDWDYYLDDLSDDKYEALRRAEALQNTNFDSAHYHNLQIYFNQQNRIKPEEVVHAVIYPVYNESLETMRPSMEALEASEFDCKQIRLYMAYEERGGAKVEEDIKTLAKEYRNVFGDVQTIRHPVTPDEVLGKGGNINMAGRKLIEDMNKEKMDFDRVVVTTIDADNRVHRKYLSALTYFYSVSPNKKSLSYQPIPLYTNNVWDVPAPIRVASTGNSFYQVIQSTRPHLMRNFSSHAQGLSGLVATGLWSARTVVEDGHQYWRSFVALKGEYDVIPLYVPIYQDAVLDNTFWKTFKAQFIQRRRWAYGCSDIPYFIQKWWQNRSELPFFRSFTRLVRRVESEVSLATASLLLAFGGWAPFLVDRLIGDSESIVALRMPGYAQVLRNLALVGIPISMYLAFKILPPRPDRYLKRRNLWMVLQWAWLPVAALCFGSLAALNSQTRMMVGRYLEKFDVTAKHIKK